MKKTLLFKLGLSEKEAEVYTSILKHGRTTPAKIAKITKLNRATVYHLCQSLVSRGLLVQDLAGKSLSLVPAKSEDLQLLLKKEREQFVNKEKTVKQLIEEVSLLSAQKQYPVPKIQFVEERRLEDHLYANAKKWNESALGRDKIWWGFQDHAFVEGYYPWIEWMWKTAHRNNLVKLLSNQSAIESKLKSKYRSREIKFLSSHADFSASIWVAGDYLIMVATRQSPHYLVEIHDAVLAHNMREVFREMWQKL